MLKFWVQKEKFCPFLWTFEINDYLCEVYSNIAMSATHNKQEHVFTPASYQYLRIIFVYVTRKENIQMRQLRPHFRGPRHRMASHGLFPTDALPQV